MSSGTTCYWHKCKAKFCSLERERKISPSVQIHTVLPGDICTLKEDLHVAIQTPRKMALTLAKSSGQARVFPWIYAWRRRELPQDLSQAVQTLQVGDVKVAHPFRHSCTSSSASQAALLLVTRKRSALATQLPLEYQTPWGLEKKTRVLPCSI